MKCAQSAMKPFVANDQRIKEHKKTFEGRHSIILDNNKRQWKNNNNAIRVPNKFHEIMRFVGLQKDATQCCGTTNL